MFSKIFSLKKSSQILIRTSTGIVGFGVVFSLVSWRLLCSTILLPFSCPLSEWDPASLKEKEEERSLNPNHSFFLREKMVLEFPDFENEIDFYHVSPRPDQIHSSPYILKLKKSQSKKSISYGEKIYLSHNEKQGLSISNNPGAFWLILQEERPPACRIQIDSPDETKVPSTILHFPVTFQKCLGCSIREHPSFLKLGQAKLWGADRLLDNPSPFRLEIQGKTGAYLCSIEEGALLYGQDDVWVPLKTDDFSLTRKKPLARIYKNSERSLEIEGWDETGEKYYTFSLFPISVPTLNVKNEEWMSSIRMKTQKKISCLLERQKMVLKAGDWLVKCSGKWKLLKNEREIQEIYDRSDQELFIFDAIETRNGIKYIRGRLFYAMRTQCLTIEIPIQSPFHGGVKHHGLSHLRGEK